LAAKKETKATAESSTKSEPKFTKEQIIRSSRFANRRDAVSACLDDDKQYTMKEVDEIINEFMKG
jgi:hypothetical protein